MSQRVLVTGAASGLGRAMAVRFAAEGWRVLAADVDAAGLDSLVTEATGTLVTRVLDVRQDEQWAAAREWCEQHWDGLDVLVNNAGVASGGLFETQEIADWDWIIELNLKSVIRGCTAFVPLFKRQGHGQIVNVASMAGLMLLPAMSSYNVTKAGVIALSKTLRYELEPYGISTTVVCPAFVRTNLTASMKTSPPAAVAAAGRMMDSSKVGPDDVAAQVLEALGKKRFLVLTHKDTRVLRVVQRYAPSVIDRAIGKRWERQRLRLEREAAAVRSDGA